MKTITKSLIKIALCFTLTLGFSFSKAQVSEGKLYKISIKSAPNTVLDVKAASTNNGAGIIKWKFKDAPQQKFYVKNAGEGYFFILAQHSNKALDASLIDTKKVHQYEFHGKDNQKWKFVSKGGGYYIIKNKKTGKVFDMTSTGVLVQWSEHGGNNQLFKFTQVTGTPKSSSSPQNSGSTVSLNPNKLYKISIKSEPNAALDIKGASTNDGGVIQKWKFKNAPQQKFYFNPAGNGYYFIYTSHCNKVLDANKKTSGISQWEYHGGDNQKWKIIPKANGYYLIKNKLTGKVLDLSSSGVLVQWGEHGKDNQLFKFTEVSGTPQKTISETGFRVKINGLNCLQSNDDGNGTDEPYFELWADGKKVITTKPRPMNEADRSWWESFTDELESWTRIAQQEFWLMPGSIYAENEVIIKLWEEDDGRGNSVFINNDDYIGQVKITKKTANSNYIRKEFRSSEEGNWDLVYSKTTRTNIDFSVEGISKNIKVRVPILDQGKEGACVAFATVGALTTSYLNRTNPGNSKEQLFDAVALYNERAESFKTVSDNCKDGDCGWRVEPCLKEIMSNGIKFKSNSKKLYLTSFYEYHSDGRVIKHYKQGNDIKEQTISTADQNGYNKMRKVIKAGEPLIATYSVYPDFTAYAGIQGIYGGQIANINNPTGHAIFVVGYNSPSLKSNSFPTWTLQNSWAPRWGKNGLCQFAEGACDFDEVMYKIGDFEVR